MIWLFMLMVGLTEDDFCTKFYALATGLVLALIQIEEHDANHELAPWGASPPPRASWSAVKVFTAHRRRRVSHTAPHSESQGRP